MPRPCHFDLTADEPESDTILQRRFWVEIRKKGSREGRKSVDAKDSYTDSRMVQPAKISRETPLE